MQRNVTTQSTPQFANLLLTVAIEPDEIGRRIKAAREKKGWTQLQFAYQASVSPSSVQRWESGRLPPVRELMRLADVLGVSVDVFVDGATASPDEDRLRLVVHEEVAEMREQIARILVLLQEPPRSHSETS